jgi:hypothetical protein
MAGAPAIGRGVRLRRHLVELLFADRFLPQRAEALDAGAQARSFEALGLDARVRGLRFRLPQRDFGARSGEPGLGPFDSCDRLAVIEREQGIAGPNAVARPDEDGADDAVYVGRDGHDLRGGLDDAGRGDESGKLRRADCPLRRAPFPLRRRG